MPMHMYECKLSVICTQFDSLTFRFAQLLYLKSTSISSWNRMWIIKFGKVDESIGALGQSARLIAQQLLIIQSKLN